MNIAGMVRDVFLRRAVVAVVVIAAVVCGAVGWKSITVEYESTGAVVAIPPGAGNPKPELNPFTNLTNTAQLAHVLATVALSEDARRAVAAKGGSPDYVVSTVAGEGSSALLSPQVVFSIRASNQWASREAAVTLIDFLRTRLQNMQRESGMVDGTFADLRVTVEPRPGVLSGADPLRTAVGYAMGGVFLALFVVVLLAGLRGTVERRRRGGAGDEDEGSDGGADAAPIAPEAVRHRPEQVPL